MITFTDPRLYVKGIATATGTNPATGEIVYFSDKLQSSSFTANVDSGELRAGLGNPIATLIASNAGVSVELSSADFSMEGMAASMGARLSSGAPKMVCQTVTATGATLSVDVSAGTPVAQLGMSDIYGYVQTVGAGATRAQTGVAYPIDPATGLINGFAATAGTTYKVWYFVNRANAQLATLTTAMDGIVMLLAVEMAVYTNVNTQENSGTRVGSLYVSALVKTTPSGAIGGSQTDYTTTTITAQAIPNDATVISGGCDDCADAGTPLAYFLYVPCDLTSGIQGLALIGGLINVPQGGSTQANFKLVLEGNNLVPVDQATMTYAMTTAITGVSVSNTGLVTASAEAVGDGELTATATVGGESYTCPVNVSVVTA